MSENIYWVYEGLIIDRDLVNKKIGEIVAHVKANEVGHWRMSIVSMRTRAC